LRVRGISEGKTPSRIADLGRKWMRSQVKKAKKLKRKKKLACSWHNSKLENVRLLNHHGNWKQGIEGGEKAGSTLMNYRGGKEGGRGGVARNGTDRQSTLRGMCKLAQKTRGGPRSVTGWWTREPQRGRWGEKAGKKK